MGYKGLDNNGSNEFGVKKIFYELVSFHKGNLRKHYLWSGLIMFMVIAVAVVVYITGGTPNTLSHLMYIPIFISASRYGIKGGIACSLISGFILGPYMPIKASPSSQEPFSWLLRIATFTFIAFVVGKLIEYIRKINNLEKRKAYEDVITGRPNLNKFNADMICQFDKEKPPAFSVILIEFENMDTVNRYISYELGQEALLKLLDEAEEFFPQGSIYSYDSNKFLLFIPDAGYKEAYRLAKDFIAKMKQPIYIKELPIAVIARGGMVCVPLHCKKSEDLVERLEKALEQATKSHSEIMMYDDRFATESRVYYKTLISLYRAIQNDTFALVYQPKISMKDKKMIGVEALLRWNDVNYKNIPISEVIKIAEDAEFISHITKWVITQAVTQLKEWQKEGIHTGVAINLSSRDLKDTAILDFTMECIKANGVDPSLLEFELTERTIVDDENVMFDVLNEIRKTGIKVSLDDYGTGHNSLKYISKLFFHFDFIKIDKQFVDEIINNRVLVEAIIKAAHSYGIEVIAEGVEEKEQHDIIYEIGCDYVQGYYFSKPLPPERLVEFAKKHSLKYEA